MSSAWEIEEQRPKLMIGIPHKGFIATEWSLSFRQLELPPHYITFERGSPIDVARNNIVHRSLKSNCEEILFLDSDIIAPTNIYFKLKRHNLDIVSGLYWTKRKPITVAAWKRTIVKGKRRFQPFIEFPQDLLFEVDATGAGALLVKTRVFKKLKEEGYYPWFRWTLSPDVEGEVEGISEDFYFFEKVNKYFKVFVDPTVKCEHLFIGKITNGVMEFAEV